LVETVGTDMYVQGGRIGTGGIVLSMGETVNVVRRLSHNEKALRGGDLNRRDVSRH
jgi:hypothetical protein